MLETVRVPASSLETTPTSARSDSTPGLPTRRYEEKSGGTIGAAVYRQSETFGSASVPPSVSATVSSSPTESV